MINAFIEWLRRKLLPAPEPMVYKHQWTSFSWIEVGPNMWDFREVDPEVCKHCKIQRRGLEEFDPCEGPS